MIGAILVSGRNGYKLREIGSTTWVSIPYEISDILRGPCFIHRGHYWRVFIDKKTGDSTTRITVDRIAADTLTLTKYHLEPPELMCAEDESFDYYLTIIPCGDDHIGVIDLHRHHGGKNVYYTLYLRDGTVQLGNILPVVGDFSWKRHGRIVTWDPLRNRLHRIHTGDDVAAVDITSGAKYPISSQCREITARDGVLYAWYERTVHKICTETCKVIDTVPALYFAHAIDDHFMIGEVYDAQTSDRQIVLTDLRTNDEYVIDEVNNDIFVKIIT